MIEMSAWKGSAWTLALLAALAGSAQAQRMEPATEPVVAIESPGGLSAGLRAQWDRREFKVGEARPLSLDLTHIVARLGADLAPFAHAWVEAGMMQAEGIADEGEAGLEWAVGGDLNALEYVIRKSPVVGKREWLGLNLAASYRQQESNFDERDLRWNEIRLLPYLKYGQNLAGEDGWRPYHPDGMLLRLGLAMVRADGEYGSKDLEENRNFGALFGVDLRWHSGWVTRLDVLLFGSEEREVSLGISRFF